MIKHVINFLNRFRYGQKMIFVFAIFLVPLLTLNFLFLQTLNKEITFIKKERLGVEYILPLVEIIQETQKHRGMSATLLSGDITSKERRSTQERIVEEKIVKLQEVDKKLDKILNSTEKFQNLKSKWDAMIKKIFLEGGTEEESFTLHTALISDMLDLVGMVQDNSNLSFDLQLNSHYLHYHNFTACSGTLWSSQGFWCGCLSRRDYY